MRGPVAVIFALAGGCRATVEPAESAESVHACASAEELCGRIADGEWQLALEVDATAGRYMFWYEGCVTSVEVAQAAASPPFEGSDYWWLWRRGYWVDAGANGNLSGWRFPDCALVVATNFPSAISEQDDGPWGGEDTTILWQIGHDASVKAVDELVRAMEASWGSANPPTNGERHYLYDAWSGEEDGEYQWTFCRVQDLVNVLDNHLTCHQYTYDPITRLLEMHQTWGEELPCDAGTPGYGIPVE